MTADAPGVVSQMGLLVTQPCRANQPGGIMRRTHNRSQRFGGHTRHARYCSCGRVVWGNGGTNHFYGDGGREYGERRDGHERIGRDEWERRFGTAGETA